MCNSTVLNPLTGFNTGGSLSSASANLPMFIDAVRLDNSVQYLSPWFGGFRVQAMVAAGEQVADSYHGLKLTYSRGPVNVTGSYELSTSNLPGSPVDNRILSLAGNYDFRVVKVFGGYQKNKNLRAGSAGVPITGGTGTQAGTFVLPGVGQAADRSHAFTAGASVPLGAFLLATTYTKVRYETPSGVSRTIGKAAVYGQYNLSKQTSLYAGYGQAIGDLKDYVLEKNVLQVGLRKAF